MMSSLGGDKARSPREKALPASAHTSQPQKQIQVSHCIPKTTVLWNADILRGKKAKKNKPQHNHDKQFIWWSVLKSIFFCFDCSFTIMHFILWQYKVISDNSKQNKHLNSFSLYFTYFIPHFSLGKSCPIVSVLQATAEQIRLAQMIYDKNDADFEGKVNQVSDP